MNATKGGSPATKTARQTRRQNKGSGLNRVGGPLIVVLYRHHLEQKANNSVVTSKIRFQVLLRTFVFSKDDKATSVGIISFLII